MTWLEPTEGLVQLFSLLLESVAGSELTWINRLCGGDD